MDACIVNVTGGELSAAEIDAYKRRALDLYGRMPCRIDIRVEGDEVELEHHFTYRPVVYRGIRSTLEVFDDDVREPAVDRPFSVLPGAAPGVPGVQPELPFSR